MYSSPCHLWLAALQTIQSSTELLTLSPGRRDIRSVLVTLITASSESTPRFTGNWVPVPAAAATAASPAPSGARCVAPAPPLTSTAGWVRGRRACAGLPWGAAELLAPDRGGALGYATSTTPPPGAGLCWAEGLASSSPTSSMYAGGLGWGVVPDGSTSSLPWPAGLDHQAGGLGGPAPAMGTTGAAEGARAAHGRLALRSAIADWALTCLACSTSNSETVVPDSWSCLCALARATARADRYPR